MTTPLLLSTADLSFDWTAPALFDVFCALGALVHDAGAGRPMRGGDNGKPFLWSTKRSGREITFLFDLTEKADLSQRYLSLRGIVVDRKKFA